MRCLRAVGMVFLAFIIGTLNANAQTPNIRCSSPREPRGITGPFSSEKLNLNVKDGFPDIEGAKGDGVSDDTAAFQAAIDRAPEGGEIIVPPGRYIIGSTIIIDRPVSLVGTGIGSQLYASDPTSTLILLNHVHGVTIRGLFLGSPGNTAGTDECSRLIHVYNSNHNRIDNVILWGGRVGIHLNGSILNTLIDITTGSNLRRWGSNDTYFFKDKETKREIGDNEFWIFSDRDPVSNITSQANTLIGARLEGGKNGIVIVDPDYDRDNGINMVGGAIEGVSGIGVYIYKSVKPVNITGVHFENNALDLVTFEAANIRLTSIFSIPNENACEINGRCGIVIADSTRNVQITDSIVDRIQVGSDSKRIVIQNVTFGNLGNRGYWDYCDSKSLNLPDRTTTYNQIGALDIIFAKNVGNNCGAQ